MGLSEFELANAYPQNGHPGQFFLDSGAHTWHNEKVRGKKHKDIDWDIFDIDKKAGREFKQYINRYGRFCKRYESQMDYYVNVDVIFNPELSWKVLKYLENEFGLSPLPVIHAHTDLVWIEKHIEAGYDYLGLGGLGQGMDVDDYTKWATKVFRLICPKPERLPIVKTHGFALTAFRLLLLFPWYSVDSTSWLKCAGFGGLYVPHRTAAGEFTFEQEPHQISVSAESPDVKKKNGHINNLERTTRDVMMAWLEHIDVPLGKADSDNNPIEWGVVTSHPARKIANLKFYEKLIDWIGPYPQRYNDSDVGAFSNRHRTKKPCSFI